MINFGGNPVALKEMRARMHLFCTRRRLWPGAAAGVNFFEKKAKSCDGVL